MQAHALQSCLRLRGRDALPQEVSPGLYIGSFGAARNRDALATAGITHVVCACAEAEPVFPDELRYLHLRVRDEMGVRLSEHFDAAIAFIDAALASGGAVLVHCVMGRSRSATIVAAYLMRTERLPMLAALARIRAVRPIVSPNPSFALQLLRLERALGIGVAAAAPAAACGARGAGGVDVADGAPPLTWWQVTKLVFGLTPLVGSFLAALPSIALLPPVPSYAQVAHAARSGRLPAREMAAALGGTLLALATAALAGRVARKGRALAKAACAP